MGVFVLFVNGKFKEIQIFNYLEHTFHIKPQITWVTSLRKSNEPNLCLNMFELDLDSVI